MITNEKEHKNWQLTNIKVGHWKEIQYKDNNKGSIILSGIISHLCTTDGTRSQCAQWKIFSPPVLVTNKPLKFISTVILVKMLTAILTHPIVHGTDKIIISPVVFDSRKIRLHHQSCCSRGGAAEPGEELAVWSHSSDLAELCLTACFISAGMCLFTIRAEATMRRRENERQSCDDAFVGCTIISRVKRYGQVFISSCSVNHSEWFHNKATSLRHSYLLLSFMSTADYSHIFHSRACIFFFWPSYQDHVWLCLMLWAHLVNSL